MLDSLKAPLDDGLGLPVAFPESLQVLLVAPELVRRLLHHDLVWNLNSIVVRHVGHPTLV